MPGTDKPTDPTPARNAWFPRSRRSPQLARRMLRELLDTVPGGHDFLEVGELLTSELVGNAVPHSGMPGRLIRVFFDVDGTRLRIEVHDASEHPPAPGSRPRPTGAAAACSSSRPSPSSGATPPAPRGPARSSGASAGPTRSERPHDPDTQGVGPPPPAPPRPRAQPVVPPHSGHFARSVANVLRSALSTENRRPRRC